MSESGWRDDNLCVSYTFTFGKKDTGQSCSLSGRARVKFSQFDPGTDLQTLGNDATGEMAVEIFRKTYEMVYLLHDALAVEAPSPWITQQISLSLSDQA